MTTFQLVNLIITILLTHLIIFELGRKKGIRDIKRIYENKDKFWIDKNDNATMAGTLSADKIKIKMPTTKTVNWNPNEYKIIKINTENGIIEFKEIKDE